MTSKEDFALYSDALVVKVACVPAQGIAWLKLYLLGLGHYSFQTRDLIQFASWVSNTMLTAPKQRVSLASPINVSIPAFVVIEEHQKRAGSPPSPRPRV